MHSETVLKIENLEKHYEKVEAVKGVTFDVRSEEIVGLLGPNGAGKTTIISMVLGVLESDKGKIEVLGEAPSFQNEVMRRVNFTSVSAHVPGNMSVWQNLYIFGLLYDVRDLKARIEELIKEFDLGKFRNKRVGVLSSGEQTRVALAKAYINSPRLLLLDEPTASLDPSSAYFIRDKVKDFAKANKAGILWTSHNMHEVETVCDRVLFLSHGKILLEGNPRELPAKYKKKNLEELFIAIAREPLVLGFE